MTARGQYPLTYDAIGNLKSYGGWTFEWEAGRQLKRQTQNATVVTYDYDHNGLRVRKTVANTSGYVYTTYNYTWHGSQLAHMTKGTDELHFFYDAQGRPAKVDYNGVIYTYVHNLQGDIVGILDSNGTVVVEYKYSAWGTQLSRTGELANTLGYANPFRYRGYIYDDETWMYWLRSRYYYPELHRFISADNVMDGAGLFGANLYAYCKNAPVGASDPSGHFEISYSEDRAAPNWRPIGGASGDRIIGAIIGALGTLASGEILKHISKPKTKTITKTKTKVETTTAPSPTPTVSPSPTPQPHQEYFPVSPFDFHPFGLIANVYPIGANSPIVIKWNIPFTKISIFEWDYDTKNGSHYHVMLPSMNNSHLEGGHYWPGDAVPEPWNSLFFGDMSSEPWKYLE